MSSTPAPQDPPIFKVSEVTRRIRCLLEGELGDLWIEGECSNVRIPASGHVYFTLKDADAQIQAAWFRGSRSHGALLPRDGMQLCAFGRVTAYEKGSQYQIRVRQAREAGAGALLAAFEKLKAKLEAEGLFAKARKQALPLLPRRIGIVTSKTGAALRDILQILERRYPNRYFLIAPVRVQGDGAAKGIAHAIDFLNAGQRADVIIVGRGGGSLEDLWCFNEEVVARAIARSGIPIISAVGHETDFTISDFVADLRAPTPSAAAELVLQPRQILEDRVAQAAGRMARALDTQRLALRGRFIRSGGSYVFKEPGHLLQRHRQSLERFQERLGHHLGGTAREVRRRLDRHEQILQHRVETRILNTRRSVDEAALSLQAGLEKRVEESRSRFDRLGTHLGALSPFAVLDRGFSLTRDAEGRVLRDAETVVAGQRIFTRLAKGQLETEVKQRSVEPDDDDPKTHP